MIVLTSDILITTCCPDKRTGPVITPQGVTLGISIDSDPSFARVYGVGVLPFFAWVSSKTATLQGVLGALGIFTALEFVYYFLFL
jgi:hypothetical protein